MDDEVKRVFTPKPMISFRIARKLCSYLRRAKLYPTKRTVGSYKCGGKRYEVCIKVTETSTFTSTVTGETYIINHRFDYNERCLVYLLAYNKCKMQYVGQTTDQFRSRWNNYKSDSRKHSHGATCMQQHLFNHFCTSGHCGFLEDVSLTFKIKLTHLIRLKGKTTGEAHLRLWHKLGLILKKVSRGFITNILSICIFIGLICFHNKGFRIYH